jgi:hypothetical protein
MPFAFPICRKTKFKNSFLSYIRHCKNLFKPSKSLFLMVMAFAYVEKKRLDGNPEEDKVTYVIQYNGKRTGCCKAMQSNDEQFFRDRLTELKRNNGINLLSRLPSQMLPVEGAVTRKPYDLSFLCQAPACHQRDE